MRQRERPDAMLRRRISRSLPRAKKSATGTATQSTSSGATLYRVILKLRVEFSRQCAQNSTRGSFLNASGPPWLVLTTKEKNISTLYDLFSFFSFFHFFFLTAIAQVTPEFFFFLFPFFFKKYRQALDFALLLIDIDHAHADRASCLRALRAQPPV